MKLIFTVLLVFFSRSIIISQINSSNAQENNFFVQDTTTQDTTTQDTTAQDTTAQDTTAQDTTAQDTTAQDTTAQDTTAQDTTLSQDTVQIPKEVRETIQERSMEIGLMFGEPTGVSYKFFITDANAVDAAAAVSFIPDAVFQLHADYLRHYFRFANVGKGRLPLTYGAGLVVQFRDDTRLGIRIPVGLTYLMENLPLSLFIDVAPRFDVTPDTDVSINASVGIRYRFFPR